MAGMGPAPRPSDQRARRNATMATRKLPAGGRTGKTPRWPLIPDIVTKARRDVWAGKVDGLQYDLEEARAEAKPTVDSLERRLDRAREELAILEARLKEQAKLERALWRDLWRLPQAAEWERLGWTRDVAQYVRHKVLAELGDMDGAKEARQWSDRLGLHPLAMLRLRWEVAAAAEEKTQQTGRGRGRYADLKVVGGQDVDASE